MLVGVGALAAGINAVAGGGSLISYPTLTLGMGIMDKIANATNSVALWPGSLAGAFGFLNLLKKTGHYFKSLFIPTLLGSSLGSYLLIVTSEEVFSFVVPWLILLAAMLLMFQPKVKAFVLGPHKKVSEPVGWIIQFLVSVYGGYFGAGMGIMMLASFALYMEGTLHELNAVKNWLGLIINFVASVLFIFKGMVLADVAIPLIVGSIIGGFISARVSQRFNPDKMRLAIAIYGVGMAAVYLYRAWFSSPM
jgi:uncharacterized membrane protein YfcA